MIERLACKLGRNDEVPNIQLAEEICRNRDAAGIGEIVDGLLGKSLPINNSVESIVSVLG